MQVQTFWLVWRHMIMNTAGDEPISIFELCRIKNHPVNIVGATNLDSADYMGKLSVSSAELTTAINRVRG